MTSFGAKVFTGSILAMIGLITVKVVVATVTGLLALLSFLVFTILPIMLIGWIILKAIRYLKADDNPAFE
jgi:hypothetical protein